MDMEFDPQLWQSRVKPDPDAASSLIVGPSDALNVIESRRIMLEEGFRFGSSTPTDVFLFSIGEAPCRAQTKIGGLPYWKREQAWPTDAQGNALPFIAQIDFRQSKDFIGDRALGDLLLVFGDLPTDDIDTDIRLIWQHCTHGDSELIDVEEMPVKARFSPFYGTRWRTQNYRESVFDRENTSILEGESRIDNAYEMCTLFATQIGVDPFLLSRVEQPGILCCFAPVCPATLTRYPFLNHAEPLAEQYGVEWRLNPKYSYVEQWLTWGDSTSLFIGDFDGDGSISHDFIG